MLRKNTSSPQLFDVKTNVFGVIPFQDQSNLLPPPERRLRKVATSKVMRRQTHLPTLKPSPSLQQVINSPQIPTLPHPQQAQQTKHLSFRKMRPIPIVTRDQRMAYSQKQNHQKEESQRSKQIALRKQFLVRQKKMLPMRNCVSADTIKQHTRMAPANVRGYRKTMLARRPHQLISQPTQTIVAEQDRGNLLQKARRLARECLGDKEAGEVSGVSMEAMLARWHPF